MTLEVCVDSIESALAAAKGGAGRLELCSALSEGGLTPTLGTFQIIKENIVPKIPIFVMIRPRRGDFVHSDLELEAMKRDIEAFREAEADGFVFGVLDSQGEINCDHNKALLRKCQGKPVTFHRAFDETRPEKMLESAKLIAELGFRRILTSGFKQSAEEGIENLKRLIEGQTEVTVMPGAGIGPKNLEKILMETGCKEFHASARKRREVSGGTKISMGGGGGDLDPRLVCDSSIVAQLVQIAKQ